MQIPWLNSYGAVFVGDANDARLALEDVNDLRLTLEDANSFLNPDHELVTTLQHECYHEGCTFEKVKERKGNNEEAVCLP